MTQNWVWTTIIVFAACGGGGDDVGSGIDPRLARIDIYEAQKLRVLGDPDVGVMGLSPTAPDAIPVTGTIVFAGSASIRVENPGAHLVLLGDSNISIGFGDGVVRGTMSDFFGTNSSGAVVDYAGTIAVDGGQIDDGVSLDYAGALTATGENIVFVGVMGGAFLGDPVTALSAVDLEAGVIYNGAPADATMTVVGEVTVTP